MEIEVRQREFQEIVAAAEVHLQIRKVEYHFALLAAIEVFGRHGLEERHRLGDPRAQIGEALLVVRETRHLEGRQPGDGVLARVARSLDLARQRQHVRREPRVEEFVERHARFDGKSLGLVEEPAERRKAAREDGNGERVHCQRHGISSLKALRTVPLIDRIERRWVQPAAEIFADPKENSCSLNLRPVARYLGNTMTPSELQAYLHAHIPLSAAMQVEVAAVEWEHVLLRAPLAPNINHRETVFGGSASALSILAAWSLLHVRLRLSGVASRLVIQSNRMEYLLPIDGSFSARSSLEHADQWPGFMRLLERRGRARLTVTAELMAEGEVAGLFSGEFVALGYELAKDQ
ncbi:thioesterase domain protein [Sinorhizobium fredii NGR234]|uniref:Thioesterase domain protein n=2 Tax=Rhizobium fredii TaxID=380 RepID=C3MFQ6_SINFN|nr:thioesterase domain protein [Sinorhizobium fredii NGR234]